MELRQLRYFCAIAAHRSFRQAALEIHIAQPALSQQIRRLEAEFGTPLFDRGVRPVELTVAGEKLLPRALAILRDVEQAAAELRQHTGPFRGRVVVGAMQYLTNLELPDLLADFGIRHPEVELQLRVGNTGDLLALLDGRAIDVALCHADDLTLPPGFAFEELRREELVIIAARSHPLAALRQVSVSDLADAPFITFRPGAGIRDALESAFAEAGLTLHVRFESADLDMAFALVERELCVALVPRSSVDARAAAVEVLPLRPARLTRAVALVWRDDRFQAPAVEAFEQAARRFIRPRSPRRRRKD